MSVLKLIKISLSIKVTQSVNKYVLMYEEIYVFIIADNIVYADKVAMYPCVVEKYINVDDQVALENILYVYV
jgi:hypothetical protein